MASQNPLVSVVVPLYNKAAYIKRAIESTIGQTYKNIEIIVVNDGSTDDSLEIVKSINSKELYVVTQQNKGPGAARNYGLKLAKGEYITFLDADDEWLPEFLEHAMDRFQENNYQIACVTTSHLKYPFVPGDRFWEKNGIREGKFILNPHIPIKKIQRILAFMCPWSTVVKTEIIRELGGFYENKCLYGEDQFLYLKILLRYPVAFSLRQLVKYHTECSTLTSDVYLPQLPPSESHPELVKNVCPIHLEKVLDELIVYRTCIIASIYGSNGQWKKAGEMMKRNKNNYSMLKKMYVIRALLFTTPAPYYFRNIVRLLKGKKWLKKALIRK